MLFFIKLVLSGRGVIDVLVYIGDEIVNIDLIQRIRIVADHTIEFSTPRRFTDYLITLNSDSECEEVMDKIFCAYRSGENALYIEV